VRRLKSIWWRLRKEAKSLALVLLGAVPGGAGAWLRARCMPLFLRRLGHATTLQAGLRVTNPEKVSIGAHCNFGQDVFITGGGGVTIGDWVGFGPDVKIWSVTHRYSDPNRPWLLQGWDMSPVVIEDDVWLGANVFVMPGVTIGKGAIVSACSLVNKSIPPYAVVVGNPARVVSWRKRLAESAAATRANVRGADLDEPAPEESRQRVGS
jgi:acetyltransferase-like isoleucine patch superfamily enzyme